MKNITLRGLAPELVARLKRAAEESGKSTNQTVLDALAAHFGLPGAAKERRFTVVHHDMDHLFGRWSTAEHAEIQDRIDQGRRVDDELWR